MPTTLNVTKADLSLESAFGQPEFGLFKDTTGLVARLFTRLHPHGLQLENLKVERGSGSIGEFHILCQLYNFQVGVQVRTEKVAVACVDVRADNAERFGAAIVEALSAVKDHQPEVAFRTHVMTLVMHGRLEGKSVGEYLSTFVKNIPTGLGPQTGNGGVIYFGAKDDRILSALTFDMSALLPDGLFFRIYVVWDASKVETATLPARATAFVREALGAFGLEVPTLRS